jgi:hypothetical protein
MPLNLQPRPLPKPQTDALKVMFGTAQMGTLRQVIDAKATKLEVDAQRTISEACKFDGYPEKSLGELKKAGEYRTALKVLKEIEAQQTVFDVYAESTPN